MPNYRMPLLSQDSASAQPETPALRGPSAARCSSSDTGDTASSHRWGPGARPLQKMAGPDPDVRELPSSCQLAEKPAHPHGAKRSCVLAALVIPDNASRLTGCVLEETGSHSFLPEPALLAGGAGAQRSSSLRRSDAQLPATNSQSRCGSGSELTPVPPATARTLERSNKNPT